ncbi:MAG: HAD-IIIA family hydrolase [Ignavibacteria bacterium]|jgi:3-deoxy-D-manno-octulosonate 8-phosphate phosphatase (KDO 8-P phosphatase)
MELSNQILEKAKRIKLVMTDCDGVLTDTGVYYSHSGEEMKRFSIRDGMGVERLRKFAGIETGIISGENTDIMKHRARKLKIEEIHLGIKDKVAVLKSLCEKYNIGFDEIAFIGDDTNDVEIMNLSGFTACPSDATKFAKEVADVIVESKGGYGAFRDFAEIIIHAKSNNK